MEWLPFDLHPEYPPEGIARADLDARYGTAFAARVREMVEETGARYAPPPDVVPRSRQALELTELARDRGLHAPLHRRLMEAYWTESADIGDRGTLLRLAVGAGLDRDEAEAALEEGRYGARVDAATGEAQRLGIHAIPAFVLNNRMLVLGAQPHEVFERILDQDAEAAGS